jgi:integrase
MRYIIACLILVSHGYSNGSVVEEFQVQQQKTGDGVRVALSPNTIEILMRWIAESGKGKDDYLFTGLRRSQHKAITREGYRLLVKQWMKSANLDPAPYSTHSLRRTKASIIYDQTQNVEAVRILLGQHSVSSTSHYLGLGKSDALKIAKSVIV